MTSNRTSPVTAALSRDFAPEAWRFVPCKLWTGFTHKGYGRVWANGKHNRVHRLAYEEAYGPIPERMVVCHHCDVPGCYEIAHLFLGTQRENMRDAAQKGRMRNPLAESHAAKTHCPQGHPYIEGNIYWHSNGKWRTCRACVLAGQARTREQRRGDRKAEVWRVDGRTFETLIEAENYITRPTPEGEQ